MRLLDSPRPPHPTLTVPPPHQLTAIPSPVPGPESLPGSGGQRGDGALILAPLLKATQPRKEGEHGWPTFKFGSNEDVKKQKTHLTIIS